MLDSINNFSYIHMIIAVDGRESVIPRHFCEAMEREAKMILQINGNQVLACKHERDHMHALVNNPVDLSIDDNVQMLKNATQDYVKKEGIGSPNFKWQDGYYAVTCSASEIGNLVNYIEGQQEYHRSHTFKEEYITLLETDDIPYKPEDLFAFVDLKED